MSETLVDPFPTSLCKLERDKGTLPFCKNIGENTIHPPRGQVTFFVGFPAGDPLSFCPTFLFFALSFQKGAVAQIDLPITPLLHRIIYHKMIILYTVLTHRLLFSFHTDFEIFDKFVESIKLQMRESMENGLDENNPIVDVEKVFKLWKKCDRERLEWVHYKIKGYLLSELISVTTSLSLVSFHPSHLLLNGTMILGERRYETGDSLF